MGLLALFCGMMLRLCKVMPPGRLSFFFDECGIDGWGSDVPFWDVVLTFRLLSLTSGDVG